jgi:hypothetical protein
MGANGGTRHVYYLTPEEAAYVIKLNYIAQPFGIVAVGLGKVAVALLILRIVGNTSIWRKRFLWVLIVLTGVFTILTAIFTFVQCKTPAALWTPALQATTDCWDPSVQSNFSIFASAWNCFVDFVLALMPCTIIWGLKMSTRKKISLGALLGLGIFTGVCAAVKTAQLVSLAARADLTWETFDLYLWTSAEIFLVIVCGSIPTLKPLWDRFVGSKVRTHRGTGYSSNPWSSRKYEQKLANSSSADLQRSEDADPHELSDLPEAETFTGTQVPVPTNV